MNLLVIGGGPAGAAAAITAKQAGLDVTMLDESQFPRPRPGETLHPGIEPLLVRLGAAAAVLDGDYLRHHGTWVRWGKRDEFIPFGEDENGPWRGFQAPRDDFDARLLGVAEQCGAEVIVQRAALSVIRDGHRVIGVQTEDGPEYAQFTLDATGSKHWLARQLNVPVALHSKKLVARYGYIDSAPIPMENLPRIRADQVGWTWMADLGQGRYLWTRVTEPSRRPVNAWIPEEWRGTRSLGSRGADVTWRLAAQTAGQGWFLCGDAAAVLDPSSSHGVLRAVMSGMMAAHLAAASLAGTISPDEGASSYDQWIRDWFHHDAAKMAEGYREAGLFGY